MGRILIWAALAGAVGLSAGYDGGARYDNGGFVRSASRAIEGVVKRMSEINGIEIDA